jgi:hypothetical protein
VQAHVALPGSLVLGAGAAVGLAIAGPPSDIGLGPQGTGVSIPDAGAFATALTALVIAQIPLTFGNSASRLSTPSAAT